MNAPVISSRLENEAKRVDGAMRGVSLNIRGLRKSFGANEVLRGLDLEIAAGQFVAVVGKSGCGKSTLLRQIVGLDKLDSGDFWFDQNLRHPQARDAVRIMFQEPRLLPWASVVANVEVGLGQTTDSKKARQLALEALHWVELEDKANEWPSRLSGGQRQRVALARALVTKPRFLGLDEPLGALDALTRIAMQRLLEHIWLDQGFTALLITHDVHEAVTLADRVIMLEQGQVALDVKIDLPRPRHADSAELARHEAFILDHILKEKA